MRSLCLLGATGSIGTQTLDLVRLDKTICLKAFSFGNNIKQAIKIINEFNPSLVCAKEEEDAFNLSKQFPHIEFCYGREGLIKVATYKCDNPIVLNALVGIVGLEPTYHAILHNRDIYLANKETLVVGGNIIMLEAKKRGINIIPLDSEHSAIYQLLDNESTKEIRRLIITASGGSVRDIPRSKLSSVTASQVLNHPNWKMGAKITVDSATMMNKGFEVIEAYHLFDVAIDQIKVLIHRNSIVHSMVEFNDYSICAQLASPDMHLPIHYAIYGKKHTSCDIIKPLDLNKLFNLQFEELDNERYPLVQIAIDALNKGGIYPCILNASNEAAVKLFLDGSISFIQIEKIIINELKNHEYEKYNKETLTIEDLLLIDQIVKNNILTCRKEEKKCNI